MKQDNRAKLKQYLETDNKNLKKERSNLRTRLNVIDAQIRENDERLKKGKNGTAGSI